MHIITLYSMIRKCVYRILRLLIDLLLFQVFVSLLNANAFICIYEILHEKHVSEIILY